MAENIAKHSDLVKGDAFRGLAPYAARLSDVPDEVSISGFSFDQLQAVDFRRARTGAYLSELFSSTVSVHGFLANTDMDRISNMGKFSVFVLPPRMGTGSLHLNRFVQQHEDGERPVLTDSSEYDQVEEAVIGQVALGVVSYREDPYDNLTPHPHAIHLERRVPDETGAMRHAATIGQPLGEYETIMRGDAGAEPNATFTIARYGQFEDYEIPALGPIGDVFNPTYDTVQVVGLLSIFAGSGRAQRSMLSGVNGQLPTEYAV
jgi:hypothetical protein